MVNWSGQAIPTSEMMIMRRVAVEIISTPDITEIGFEHNSCAGIVRHTRACVYGGVGGQLFFGDFGAKNNQPNTVDFFLPRHTLHRTKWSVLFEHTLRRVGDSFVSDGDPLEIDGHSASGSGRLIMTVRG